MIKIKSPKEQLNTLSHQRAIVIECSVAIEHMISNQVCYLMDIDRTSSKLFGMGSSSLSFNQKVELLTEIKYYTKEQKEQLNRFAEIRNKFAHIAEIKNFEDCINSIKGLESKLLKWYPEIMSNSKDPREDIYSKCFTELFNTIAKDIERFVEHYNSRLFHRYSLEVKADNYDAMLTALTEVGDEFDPKIMEKFSKRFLERTNEIFDELDERRKSKKKSHKIMP